MATATATPSTRTPDIKVLRKQRESVEARRAAYQRRHDEIHGLIGAMHVVTGAENATAADRRRAHVDKTKVEDELQLALAELHDLDAAIRAAEDVERERLRDMFVPRKRAAVGKLHALLVKAAEANAELTSIEDEENAACGTATRFNWPEFQPETPTTASRLASWIRHCREHRVLD